ncbi:hypothetical protein A0J61_02428 [Choanephora cucurbitarum]|uniref:Uncharacterized protein n=1 Tax=Choanephora cucurbitarum TaxID=101091 RepID=A0A1C7NKM3_9FUNG|nr:hypothetical protein A0J61_02428 [Choanephora cucurbitarum]
MSQRDDIFESPREAATKQRDISSLEIVLLGTQEANCHTKDWLKLTIPYSTTFNETFPHIIQ